jgi:hypothetical protein
VSWRAEANRAIDSGALRASKPTTIWEGGKHGSPGRRAALSRTGRATRSSRRRSAPIEAQWRIACCQRSAAFARRVASAGLQRFADSLVAEGLSPSYVHTTLLPLRAICRRALSRGKIAITHPWDRVARRARSARTVRSAARGSCADRKLCPSGTRQSGDRDVRRAQTGRAARPPRRRRRLQSRIDSRRAWMGPGSGSDQIEVQCRSKAGASNPMLRAFLASHLERAPRTETELIFGRSGTEPFTANRVQARADEAWGAGLRRCCQRGPQTAEVDHATLLPPYVCSPDDRGRRCESAVDLHGPRQHLDYAGPLRPPHARVGGRGV